jgi:ABC-type multidrug transport system ATPase subunit/pSer/pThr/pTyr-binding forkhead associated (FHA) protein/ABC-type transport system involved in multi-copper enzyme maturation permease subunit
MSQALPDVQWSTPLEVRFGDHRWVLPPGESAIIGRDAGASVVIPDRRVSRSHATVTSTARGWQFTDHSTNGSFSAGHRVRQLLITAPTIMVLGDADDGITMTLTPGSAPALEEPPRTHARLTGLHQLHAVRRTIGRAPENDLVVDDVLVSRRHAVLERTPRGWHVTDLGSANGTFINGRRVSEAPVTEGDLLGIGHALFQLSGEQLVEYVDRGDVDIEAVDLVVTRDGHRLLDGVAFHLPGRSLTAVLGPSGSGKSTLLGALTGARPADTGTVSYGGRDLYTDYDELRQRIGLVPQDDILHPQLRVSRALAHSARLRFPPDVPAAERNERVHAVLTELGLAERADQRIDSLSGGQRKRTSVALELLTRPSLLFLDEPTSGLDPGLDKQVMHSLRELADGGRTVVVVTHSVANLNVCDRLLILAPGGRVAYDGPPAHALGYFGVTDFAEVFLLLERERDRDWAARLRSADRSPPFPRPHVEENGTPGMRGRSRRLRLTLVQFWVLCRRTFEVIVADRTYLLFLAGLPVLLSGLAHAIPSPQGLSTATGDPAVAQLLLVIVVAGTLMGTAVSVREFVKERTVYQRERAIGLSRAAYLAAKLTVLGAISAAQAAVFAGLAQLRVQPPGDPVLLGSGRLEIAVAVIAVACSCMVLGLLISTAISNADRGMPVLVVSVMVQLVLSGGLFVVAGHPGLEQISWAVPFRWAYAMGTSTLDVGRLPGGVPDALWQHTAAQWVTDLLLLGAVTLVMVVLTALVLRRYDPPRRRAHRQVAGRAR